MRLDQNLLVIMKKSVQSTVWKYQDIRTISEQYEAEIAKKLRVAQPQPQPKVTGSYKKKSAYCWL